MYKGGEEEEWWKEGARRWLTAWRKALGLLWAVPSSSAPGPCPPAAPRAVPTASPAPKAAVGTACRSSGTAPLARLALPEWGEEDKALGSLLGPSRAALPSGAVPAPQRANSALRVGRLLHLWTTLPGVGTVLAAPMGRTHAPDALVPRSPMEPWQTGFRSSPKYSWQTFRSFGFGIWN